MSNFFARQAVSHQRVLAKCCDSLYGICAGILADQVLSVDEVRFLHLWLKEHEEIASVWPGQMIAQRISAVLADGTITSDELTHLMTVLKDFIGGTLDETGTVRQSTRLPIDDSVEVAISGNSFCLTGDFLYGPRSSVASAITERGGILLQGVRKDLDFLVVGFMTAREWKFENYGTKIQKAVDYQERGEEIAIISEQHWKSAL